MSNEKKFSPNENNIPSVFMNILSQVVLPRVVNKVMDSLDKPNMSENESSNSTNTMIYRKPPIQRDQRVVVNLNFFINDPERKIDPNSYVPIKFIE